jgi:hypothetical protein
MIPLSSLKDLMARSPKKACGRCGRTTRDRKTP